MKLGKLYGNPIDCLRDTLDTVRERGNYSRYSPGSYIALDNYVNGIDSLHEPATPHYPVPAIRYEILIDSSEGILVIERVKRTLRNIHGLGNIKVYR